MARRVRPRVEDQMLEDAEDALDSHTARIKLAELKDKKIQTVTGGELEARLAKLMAD